MVVVEEEDVDHTPKVEEEDVDHIHRRHSWIGKQIVMCASFKRPGARRRRRRRFEEEEEVVVVECDGLVTVLIVVALGAKAS